MERIGIFNAQQLEAISRILAETSSGLTGSEIARLLQECRISDVNPGMTKWKRLFNAFVENQNRVQLGNHVLMFINRAMNPVMYTGQPGVFASRQAQLNSVLAFCGMAVGDDGKLRHAAQAHDLDDAIARADKLHRALATRNVHPDVLKYCRAELIDKNYFHAVFEAMKSIAAKIRALSGLKLDGADLVKQSFGVLSGETPLLAINSLETETDRGEQRGFINLLIGLFGTIRNPAAHNPKIEWEMSEQDALDILTMASLVHRKLDKAQRRTGAV
jgi:uncharacterized protein (TIGR02391 family)